MDEEEPIALEAEPIKHAGGRPSVVDDRVVAKLEEAFVNDMSVASACLYAGISRNAFYRFIANHPEYKDRFETLREALKIRAKLNIADKIKAGDIEVSQWWLERRLKAEYSPRAEVSGPDGGPLQIEHQPSDMTKIVLGTLTDDQLRLIEEQTAKQAGEENE